jgi:glyoxylase-like metal-dependent hydrolase (beta-lactamase superfamily II)/rhodanese-related sulfurtransferase
MQISDFTSIDGGTSRAKQVGMLFRQLFDAESATYTYLIADEATREAAIIDPVREQVARDLELLRELDLKLIYTLETHVHADHVTGSGALRDATGARIVVARAAGASCADIHVDDHQVLSLGRQRIEILATPGHTAGCVSYRMQDRVFTGDALLIRGTGRTDFQSGSAPALYDSINVKLFHLPDETLVYPGHDYKGRTVSTIGEEKRFNPRLAGKSKEEFIKIMGELRLAPPKKISEALPANLACGQPEKQKSEIAAALLRESGAQRAEGYFEIDHRWARDHAREKGARIVDVRSADEFAQGHLEGAELVPLETLASAAVSWNRRSPILTVCRSGKRSASAARTLEQLGFEFVASLRGGMVAVEGA